MSITDRIADAICSFPGGLAVARRIVAHVSEHAKTCEQVREGKWTVEHATLWGVSEAIKHWVQSELDGPPVWPPFHESADAQAARDEWDAINWQELSRRFIQAK